MKSGQAGGIWVRVLLVLGAAAVLVGVALWLVQRQDSLATRLALAEEALTHEKTARQALEAELARARELYELVGSELSSRNEEFSKVLNRAVGGREAQLREIRNNLDELGSRLSQLRQELETLRAETEKTTSAVAAEVKSTRETVNLALTDLQGLRSRLEAAAEELSRRLERTPRPQPIEREWVLELDNVQTQRMSDLDKRLTGELGWLKGEVDRLRREVDALGHQLSRLETRRQP